MRSTSTLTFACDQLIEYRDFAARSPVVPLADHRNSPIATWNPTTEAIEQLARYDLHGRLTVLDANEMQLCAEQDNPGVVCDPPSAMPFAFNGRWRSPLTGLVNMRARWYSPRLGQFTAPDPLGYVAAGAKILPKVVPFLPKLPSLTRLTDDALSKLKQKALTVSKVCSFTEGTPVLMCDGSLKSIEDVEEGEFVLARDETTGEVLCKQVVAPYENPDRSIIVLELADEHGNVELIETTDNHPFFVADRGWTRVDELVLGDLVPSADGTMLTVVGASWTSRVEAVYNFGVEGFHTYFVGELGAWVHNCFPFASLRGKSEKYFKKRKPSGWKTAPADRGLGWKWIDENGRERFRYMRPDKKGRRNYNNRGYIRWQNSNGDFLDIDGNVIPKPSRSASEAERDAYQRAVHIKLWEL